MLRALWRLAAATGQALGGALICALVFPFISPPQRMAHVGRWSARMLRALGIRLAVRGSVHPGPVLLVANHISWVDILAIDAVHPARFVSKADVKRWPLIGYLVASGGTLFIERERKRDAMRVVHQMAAALEAGDTVAVFPEGTTGDGRALLPFHANLLQAAIATGSPLQPVALRYSEPGHPVSPATAWVGETTLVQNLWAVACAEGLTVRVQVLPPLGSRHADRRALVGRVQDAIAAALGEAEA